VPGAAAAVTTTKAKTTKKAKNNKNKKIQHTEPQISTKNRLHKLILICEYNLGSLTNTDPRNN
jgi:hypothetical protein